jgi:hypothetical protein
VNSWATIAGPYGTCTRTAKTPHPNHRTQRDVGIDHAFELVSPEHSASSLRNLPCHIHLSESEIS